MERLIYIKLIVVFVGVSFQEIHAKIQMEDPELKVRYNYGFFAYLIMIGGHFKTFDTRYQIRS